MHQNDTARAADALRAIPPDLPRDEWVRAAMGAHAAGLDFDDFDQWSAQAGNYDAAAARDTWRSIKPGAIGPGTLFRMAAEHGHHADKPQHESPSKPASKPSAAAQARPRHEHRGGTARKPLQPSMATSPRRAPCVPLDGLRVLPQGDPLRIRGASMAVLCCCPATARTANCKRCNASPRPATR